MSSHFDKRIANLSPAKRALLAKFQERRGTNRYPVSSTQFGMWLFEQLHPGSCAYHNPAAIVLDGRLDVAAMQAALADVQNVHSGLRTCLEEDEDGVPQQVVAPRPDPVLHTIEATDLEAARLAVARHSSAPFDLASGPIWRALVVRLPDERDVLALTMHHIVSDGWSLRVVLEDLGRAYAARRAGESPQLPEVGLSLGEFVAMEQAKLEDGARARLVSHWSEIVKGCVREAGLPSTGRPLTADAATVSVCLTDSDTTCLSDLSRRNASSLFGGVLALYAATICAWSHDDDLIITTPIARRMDPASRRIVGCLLNTVPIRVRINREASFQDLVRSSGAQMRSALTNSALPFSDIAALAPRDRASSSASLSNVMLVHNNAGDLDTFAGIAARVLKIPVGGVKIDWALHLEISASRIAGQLEYPTHRFEYDVMTAVAGTFCASARIFSEHPDIKLGALLDSIAPTR